MQYKSRFITENNADVELEILAQEIVEKANNILESPHSLGGVVNTVGQRLNGYLKNAAIIAPVGFALGYASGDYQTGIEGAQAALTVMTGVYVAFAPIGLIIKSPLRKAARENKERMGDAAKKGLDDAVAKYEGQNITSSFVLPAVWSAAFGAAEYAAIGWAINKTYGANLGAGFCVLVGACKVVPEYVLGYFSARKTKKQLQNLIDQRVDAIIVDA